MKYQNILVMFIRNKSWFIAGGILLSFVAGILIADGRSISYSIPIIAFFTSYLIVFANAIKIRENVSNLRDGIISDVEFERDRKTYWSIIIGILLGWVALIIISQFI